MSSITVILTLTALMLLQAEQVLGGARSSRADAEVLADNSVLAHFRQMQGSDVASSSSAAGPGGAATKQRPIEGECAICYDSLEVCHLLCLLLEMCYLLLLLGRRDTWHNAFRPCQLSGPLKGSSDMAA